MALGQKRKEGDPLRLPDVDVDRGRISIEFDDTGGGASGQKRFHRRRVNKRCASQKEVPYGRGILEPDISIGPI